MASSLVQVPLFARLANVERILIAGCGGGFDIYCGLPLALALRAQNKQVTLANLSFANPTTASRLERISDVLTRIDGDTEADHLYFPELYLARWLRDQNLPSSVYCFARTGVIGLQQAYLTLVERERIQAVVVVDGGTDSLMRGNEAGLGTPEEDASTLVAVSDIDLPKILVCLGFGIDAFHGVCHAQFLENTAELVKIGAFLGTLSLLPEQPETEAYLSAVEYATEQQRIYPSIVNTSVAAAISGCFGDHHPTARTRGSKLFINPLMAMYWCYQLQAVVDRMLYADMLRSTKTWPEVVMTLRGVRIALEGQRRYSPIPL